MDFKELNFDYSPLADAWTADDIELVGNKLYFYYPQADGVFKIPAQSVIEAENAEEIIAKYNLEGVRQIKTNLVSVENFLKRFGKNIKFLENISFL